MNKILCVLILTGACASTQAADPDAGKELFLFTNTARGNCLDCHGDDYFSDPQQRLVESFHELKGYVQGCNLEFDVGWFPEDEDNVAAYLNQRYYRFPAE